VRGGRHTRADELGTGPQAPLVKVPGQRWPPTCTPHTLPSQAHEAKLAALQEAARQVLLCRCLLLACYLDKTVFVLVVFGVLLFHAVSSTIVQACMFAGIGDH
jgi:hypothetical protein